jgi:uncharacterized phage protein (TIGR01671 family)
MSREIKYRVFHKKRKKMYDVHHLHCGSLGVHEGNWATCKARNCIENEDCYIQVQPEDAILMQYTGWQTKPNPNQVDIYGGDLFCVEDVGICEVEFKHGSWYLGDELLYEFEESDGKIGWGIKLMGNKFQNPELLK